MQPVIIYPTDTGVAVIHPAPGFAAADLVKDVPADTAYRIIDAADLPDRASRDRWRWTESGPLTIAPIPEE